MSVLTRFQRLPVSALMAGLFCASSSAWAGIGAEIGATLTDSIADANGDGKADPGEQIDYETVLTELFGFTTAPLTYVNPLDPNTTLVPGSLKSTPLARNDSYSAVGNVGLNVPAGSGLLANDFDLGPTAISVTLADGSGTAGSVLVNADGSFTYNPPPGYEGTTTFTYRIEDENGHPLPAPATGSNEATVTIVVSGRIWFIDDDAAPGGNGTMAAPFNSLAGHNSNPNDLDGDGIFLYSGSYSGGITLQNGQKLIGEGATGTLEDALGIVVPPGTLPALGGSRPVITTASGNGISLGNGNTVRGLDVGNTAGDGLFGSNFGSLAVSEVAISGAGRGVNLSNGTLTASFDSISSSGANNGIRLADTSGSFTITGDAGTDQNNSGGTIANTSGPGIHLSNASGITLNQILVDNTGSHGVEGFGVSDLTINDSVFEDLGNAAGESAFFFDQQSGMAISGNFTLSNVDVTRYFDRGVNIFNASGNLNMDVVNGCSFIDGADTTAGASFGQAIVVETEGSAGIDLNVNGGLFDFVESDAVRLEAGGSGANNLDVIGITVTNPGGPDNFPNGGSINVIVTDNRSLNFDIQGNSLADLPGDGILVSGNGSMSGRIGGPSLGDGNEMWNDSASLVGDMILITGNDATAASGRSVTLLVQNNFLGQNAAGSITTGFGDDGVGVLLGDSNSTYNVTVSDNTIRQAGPGGAGPEPIDFFMDDDNGTNPVANVAILNNSIVAVTGNEAIQLDTRETITVCTSIFGNTNGSGGPMAQAINLDGNAPSTLSITQADLGALSSANAGTVIDDGTGVTFSTPCNPTLPIHP